MLHILMKNDCEEEKQYIKEAVLMKPYGMEKSKISGADGLFVCPYCGKTTEYHKIRMYKNKNGTQDPPDNIYNLIYTDDENVIRVYKCTDCGKRIPTYDDRDKDPDIPYYPILQISSYPCNDEVFKTSEQVLYDDENGKLWIYASFVNIFITDNHVSYEPFYQKFVVNLKNHTSWYIGPRTFGGKRAFGSTGASVIRNCTYGKMYPDMYVFSDKSVEIMFDQFIKLTKYPRDIIDSMKDKDAYYKSLVAYYMIWMNSCPNVLYRYSAYNKEWKLNDNGHISDYEFEHIRRSDYYDGSLFKDFSRNIEDTETFMNRIVEKYHLPFTKSFKRLYMSDVKWLAQCAYFKKLGFHNIDILQSLLKMNVLAYGLEDGFDVFVKHMVKHSGEHVASRKLLEYYGSEVRDYNKKTIFRDAVRMYYRVYKYDKKLASLVDWGRSIKQIHDSLSKLHTKIEFENKEIPYSSKDSELRGTFDNCDFELPVDTNRLIEVGTQLGNCVGSYRDCVLNKQSIIVLMNNNERVVGCIELVKGRNLRQLSAKYNNPVSIEYKPAFDAWAQKNGIKNLSNCSGYVNFGVEMNHTHDWHALELDENGDVIKAEFQHEELPF